ncbi:fused MFS/spermidine synthase [Candidatus Berkiella aquae]|uniref:Spermidine synthase n=1 Tax=Candidatus Berkiella aquae TaxID=295108 RepID=A0A0Q9YQ70_9GAMM|nr:fused MFS/spermidine synthase [Candidatus Berkiella aquae]MCS5712724.1 fused MFS/spermidine synthase [Candidatus Berkiella aquae]
MIAFSASIFLSAFLLFIIQPLLAKTLLPLFGGSPAVWLSNLVFYQTALLIGYAYAYFVTKLSRLSWQATVHFTLLAFSLLLLPITPATELSLLTWWQPLTIFAVLGSTLLIPVIVLSATSPLLQYWYYHSYHSDFPYRYYALSNLGSLLGLFAFPLLLEPFLGLKIQLTTWSIGYTLFTTACALCAFITFKQHQVISKERTNNKTKVPRLNIFSWLLLTALSSALLLTTTQVMMQNVIGLPLLWVIPLALYLISFIIVFYQPRLYVSWAWISLFFLLTAGIIYLPTHHQLTLAIQVLAYTLLLFSGCMICHGELYRLKPDKQHLTFYYLMVALGGVLGGLFVNLVSPLIFNEWWDFYGALLLILLYAIFVPMRQDLNILSNRIVMPLSLLAFFGIATLLIVNIKEAHREFIFVHRNFLGKFEIVERYKNENRHLLILRNGNILHGQQYLEAQKRSLPTTYYSQKSGLGVAIDFLRYNIINTSQHLRIGAIGLGTGTIAALGHKGDFIRFYEIDPDIEKVANEYFYYLRDSAAKIEIDINDGRLALAKELHQGSQQYDLIVVDAFNGDAIPLHLLTKEALDIYLGHLKQNGILAFHISSRYVDLYPPLQALAAQMGLFSYLSYQPPSDDPWIAHSEWLLISRQSEIGLFLYNKNALSFRNVRMNDVWTDDFNYLLPIIRW